MKITVSGIVGSGKSTVSKMLAEKLGLEYFSVGGIMRQIAVEKGIHLKELTEHAKGDEGVLDKELDDRQIKIGKIRDNFVMDSRLGFHFIPDSFKVFLYVDLDEGARRIFSTSRGEESYLDVEEAKEYMVKRMSSEKQRYQQYYNLDFPDGCGFDFEVDTTDMGADEVVEKIIQGFRTYSIQKS